METLRAASQVHFKLESIFSNHSLENKTQIQNSTKKKKDVSLNEFSGHSSQEQLHLLRPYLGPLSATKIRLSQIHFSGFCIVL